MNMSKTIYGLAAAAVLVPTLALASPGDDGCIGNCPQEGGSGGPVEVSNVNTNTNDNSASAAANSESASNSSATGIGLGGSADNTVDIKTGGASSRSSSTSSGGAGGQGGSAYASGGHSYASGGDADSRSYSEGGSVGDTSASTGDSNASVGDTSTGDLSSSVGVSTGVAVDASDNSSYSVEYTEASSRAANVYSQVCQNGGSAQGMEGGFGVTNQDVLCDHLKTAAFMREAYIFEMQYGTVQCQELMEGQKVVSMEATYSDTCMNEKALKYYEAYHESMDDAIKVMDQVEEAGMLDKFMGYMVRPAALIGALIWLI